MIVISRNGKTTVLRGWRAALAGATALVATWAVLAMLAFVVIGIGITVGAILLLVVPAMVVVGVLLTVVQGRQR